jgi:hypothetical protein
VESSEKEATMLKLQGPNTEPESYHYLLQMTWTTPLTWSFSRLVCPNINYYNIKKIFKALIKYCQMVLIFKAFSAIIRFL